MQFRLLTLLKGIAALGAVLAMVVLHGALGALLILPHIAVLTHCDALLQLRRRRAAA